MFIKLKELYCSVDKMGINYKYVPVTYDTYINSDKIESVTVHNDKAVL